MTFGAGLVAGYAGGAHLHVPDQDDAHGVSLCYSRARVLNRDGAWNYGIYRWKMCASR